MTMLATYRQNNSYHDLTQGCACALKPSVNNNMSIGLNDKFGGLNDKFGHGQISHQQKSE